MAKQSTNMYISSYYISQNYEKKKEAIKLNKRKMIQGISSGVKFCDQQAQGGDRKFELETERLRTGQVNRLPTAPRTLKMVVTAQGMR